jgi:hypothetical protein
MEPKPITGPRALLRLTAVLAALLAAAWVLNKLLDLLL